MANYYIGGVGYVSAFTKDEKGNPIHYFDARTLTDSSINISVSSEEIRGGEGAQLLGRFFHTSVFNLSMTDALFDLKYLAAQVGSDIIRENASKMAHEEIDTAEVPLRVMPVSPIEGLNPIAWVKFDDGTYETFEVGTDKKLKDPNSLLVGQTKICVNYFEDVDACRQIIVYANYQPSEFTIYLRAKLFSGDACKPSKGQAIGEIVVEIPRFQLDGAIDLAMAMASPATFALNGSALASGCDCDGKMWYAKISEVMYTDAKLDKYNGYTDIIVLDNDELKDGDAFVVYAFGPRKRPIAMLSSEYDVNPASAVVDGKCVGQAGQSTAVTVTVKAEVAVLGGETATATIAAKA